MVKKERREITPRLFHPAFWGVLTIVLFVAITMNMDKAERASKDISIQPELFPGGDDTEQEHGKDAIDATAKEETETKEETEISRTVPIGDSFPAALPEITTRNSIEVQNLPIGADIGSQLSAIPESTFETRTMHTQEGITTYRQYVRFGERGEDIDSGRVEFTENNEGELGNFLTFQQGDILFEYGIIFDNGLGAAIENKRLEDLHNEEIFLAGQPALITNSHITTENNKVQLKLVTGGKRAMVKEGETHAFFTGFHTIPITVLQVTDTATPKTIMAINGKQAPAISAGHRVIDNEGGISVNVIRILPNQAQDGKDIVDLAIGPATITLEDVYTDDAFSASVEINGKRQLGSLVQIRGTVNEDILKISSIKFRAKAESNDLFISPGSSLTEQGQEHLNGVDIQYGGLSDEETSLIVFRSIGDKSLLSFTNNNGNPYTIPLMDASGVFQFGDDHHALWWEESSSDTTYVVEEGDYLVFTSANNRKGVTQILQYDDLDASGSRITFSDLVGGQKEVIFSPSDIAGQLGQGTLTLSKMNPHFTIGNNGNLAVDLNRDGEINGGSVDIINLGGGILGLGGSQNIAGSSTVSLTLTTEETKIQDASSDEVETIEVNRVGNNLDIDVPDQSTIEMKKAGSNLQQGLTTYGAFFELSGSSGSGRTLAIEYPISQRFVNVGVQTG